MSDHTRRKFMAMALAAPVVAALPVALPIVAEPKATLLLDGAVMFANLPGAGTLMIKWSDSDGWSGWKTVH